MLTCTACDVPCDEDVMQCPSCHRWYCSDDFEDHDCEANEADDPKDTLFGEDEADLEDDELDDEGDVDRFVEDDVEDGDDDDEDFYGWGHGV